MLQNLARLNLDSWLDYIGRIHPKEMDFGLDRILKVVRPLNWNRFSCPVVIVGGTNGKGSCVRFLENIFTAAGYRVGAYTSPHLMKFNERIRINNQMVDDQTLVSSFQQVEQLRQPISLSYFEFTFLAALQIFQQACLDLVILEVGLGGRLDAVNIVDADIAVITTIDLDHTDILGPDRESIATEKAGIFRLKKIVVCGDPQPPLNLLRKAKELQTDWYTLGDHFQYEIHNDGAWDWKSRQKSYFRLPPISLKHQNAATSLMVLECLQARLPVTESTFCQALTQTVLEGRFEKLSLGNFCYADVAHNPQGGRWLSELWRRTPVQGRRIAVLGMLGDKDIAGTVHSLLEYMDSWFVATLSVSRGATAEHLQTVLAQLGAADCLTFASVEAALAAAIASADLAVDGILIFGSFYTVAVAKKYITQEELL